MKILAFMQISKALGLQAAKMLIEASERSLCDVRRGSSLEKSEPGTTLIKQ